jgi:hypothetical protein
LQYDEPRQGRKALFAIALLSPLPGLDIVLRLNPGLAPGAVCRGVIPASS